jgi:glycosyltransferase involved in cell wall biosynthesis
VKLLPETRLFIVGENPPPSLNRATRENITLTGRVPAVTPYLDQAALVVAPLRLGGGMRIKILEALAAGKAVVTTSLAAEGLGVQDGEQLVIADTDSEFIARIVQLLRSPEERQALAERARVWACQHLTWQASVEKYAALYQELLARPVRNERQSITTLSSKTPEHPVLTQKG